MNSSLDWAVPRRRYANYAQGRDTAAMKAVVGEESLGPEDKVLGRPGSFRARMHWVRGVLKRLCRTALPRVP
jgi:hypothetical protein